MKKIFYSMLMLAMAAMTFTSCEDVPMPYGWPESEQKPEEKPVDPAGAGTKDNPYNVAATLEFIETLGDATSGEIYTKGYISQIDEIDTEQYGNATFYISDVKGSTTNQLEVYRAKSLGNKRFTSTEEIHVGDEVIICGQVVNFRGSTPEFTQGAYIYSLNGSGGGGGNTPGGEAKGSGTLADPYNPAGAAAAVANLTWTSNDVYETTGDVYVKGKISRIADKGTFTDGGTYGNASFYISEDGSENGEFYCFRILYLGNNKFERGQTDIKVGDEVIVCGQLMNYRGNTPETVAGKAYLYSLNGKTESGGGGGGEAGAPSGDGTLSNPYNVAAACAAVANLTWTSNDTYDTTDEVYVKGKISRIADNGSYSQSGSYGNASFYIKDDGADAEFYCYRLLYLGNKKYESGQTDIKVGDEVIIYGKLMNYRGNTPETVANKTYLYSLNGKTESGSSGGDDSGGGDVSGNTITVTMSSFGLGNAVDAGTLTLSDGTTLTFAGGENENNSPKYYTSGNAIRMYAKNTLTIKASKEITKVVLTCANPQSGSVYNGNDMMYGEAGGKKVTTTKDSDTQVTFSGFSDKTLFICNDHTEAKAGTQLRIVSMVITYAE